MAITPLSGTLPIESSLPPINQQTATDQDAILSRIPATSDTLTTRDTLHTDRYQDEISAAAQYAAGGFVEVDYYRKIVNLVHDRATDTDLSGTRSLNHEAFDQIKSLKLIIPNSFSFEYTQENTKSKYAGEALVVPGINPHIGDVFIYAMLSGQRGVFQVTGVDRLSMDNSSYSRITFYLAEYATDGTAIKNIQQQVREVYYYNADTFLTSDHSALLTTDRKITVDTLTTLRRILINLYSKRFYLQGMGTYIGPDKSFDPYLIEHLTKTISITESQRRPTQILPEIPNVEYSIWTRLRDQYDKSVTGLGMYYHKTQLVQSMLGSLISPLVNECFYVLQSPYPEQHFKPTWTFRLHPHPEEIDVTNEDGTITKIPKPYVMSQAFYDESFVDMPQLDKWVYLALTTDRIPDGEISKVITSMDAIRKGSIEEMFYGIPLYLYLQTKIVRQLTLLTQG